MSDKKRSGSGKSGWCNGHPIEQQHDRCLVASTCTCDCHKEG